VGDPAQWALSTDRSRRGDAIVEKAPPTPVADPATEHRVVEAMDVEGASRKKGPEIHQRGASHPDEYPAYHGLDNLGQSALLDEAG
jgi:hypothetical protein